MEGWFVQKKGLLFHVKSEEIRNKFFIGFAAILNRKTNIPLCCKNFYNTIKKLCFYSREIILITCTI